MSARGNFSARWMCAKVSRYVRRSFSRWVTCSGLRLGNIELFALWVSTCISPLILIFRQHLCLYCSRTLFSRLSDLLFYERIALYKYLLPIFIASRILNLQRPGRTHFISHFIVLQCRPSTGKNPSFTSHAAINFHFSYIFNLRCAYWLRKSTLNTCTRVPFSAMFMHKI